MLLLILDPCLTFRWKETPPLRARVSRQRRRQKFKNEVYIVKL